MDTMVEAMGIEPMSESIFTGVSPSAAFVLKFRLKHRPKAGYIMVYPLVPYAAGHSHKVFLHV